MNKRFMGYCVLVLICFIHYWVVPFVDFFAVSVQKKEQVRVLSLTIYVVIVVPLVTCTVVLYLVLPEIGVGFRQNELFTPFVPMPKTAVDKDSCSVFTHYDIRFAWYTLDVQTISVSVCPQPFPNQYLRFGRLAARCKKQQGAKDEFTKVTVI